MNIQELARLRLTVDAFVQYLADRSIKLVHTTERGSVVEVTPEVLEVFKKNFHDKVIDTMLNNSYHGNKPL